MDDRKIGMERWQAENLVSQAKQFQHSGGLGN